jgi:integrase
MRATDSTLARIMGHREDPRLFGCVRPRERGEGYRLDVRPFGWIYTVSGTTLNTPEVAHAFLDVIRADIATGKSPEDAVARFLSPTARPNLVTRRYADFLRFKQQEVANGDLAARTLREYQRYARDRGELSFWEGKSLSQVDRASLAEWSQWLAARGLSAKTRRNVMGALRSCMGWLKERGGLHGDVPNFPLPRVTEHRPGIITPQAQARVLAAIPKRARGAFLVMATMGLRPGEARALAAGNVRLETRTLVVDRAMQGTAADAAIGPTKTKQYRELPLSEAMLAWLEHDLPAAADAVLFPNPRTGKRWSHWALNDTWQAACRKVSVKARLYEGTKHSFATAAKARGVGDRELRDYLGHRDGRSTEGYAKLSAHHLRDVVRST